MKKMNIDKFLKDYQEEDKVYLRETRKFIMSMLMAPTFLAIIMVFLTTLLIGIGWNTEQLRPLTIIVSCACCFGFGILVSDLIKIHKELFSFKKKTFKFTRGSVERFNQLNQYTAIAECSLENYEETFTLTVPIYFAEKYLKTNEKSQFLLIYTGQNFYLTGECSNRDGSTYYEICMQNIEVEKND